MDNITAFIRVTTKRSTGQEYSKCINVNSIAEIDPSEVEYGTLIFLNTRQAFAIKEKGSDFLTALNRARCTVYVC